MSFEKLTREQLVKAIYHYESITEDSKRNSHARGIHRLCEDCGQVTKNFDCCTDCCEMACKECNNVKLVQSGKDNLCERCLAAEK